MKEYTSKKKISPYDKFQALRRKPSYRADYWDFLFWCRENQIDETEYLDHPEAAKKAEELCNKYSITYLFNPSTAIPKHWGGSFFDNEEEIVETIYPTDYRDLSEDEIRKGIILPYLPIPVFNNGEELIIRIKLNADLEDIVKEIFAKIKYYQSFIQRDNSRMTPDRKIDKWEVWDAYNRTKSFKKAAETLNKRASLRIKILNDFGFRTEPLQKVNISTVRKAYYRAFEPIHGVKFDPAVHKPEKLPVRLSRTCDRCPERSTCKALCPDILEYVVQDKKSQRETLKLEHELDILSGPRIHRKAPKPRME
ncbi:MAG: hypothetical protein FJ134_06750 [Deltaproteobacteria bacterium]|nr:hypothetical protein [Deltaproteobacteria bacterium]